ncbi:MAG TPA: peptidylprolyl isomerase, partial [Rhodanobacteraceae bacterium]|nr:peptidylprolyl isomerase [Rhodanobacteraceae bacterium]
QSKLLTALLLSLLSFSAVAGQADSVATPTQLPPGVVVEQGGAQISLKDVDAFAMTVPDSARPGTFGSARNVERILRGLVANRQLADEARKLHMQDDPAVAARMAAAAEKVLVEARIEALTAKYKASVPDLTELARERYIADPASYAVGRVVDVKHILIDTKKHTDAEAKALADKLYAELKADPAAFDQDVAKYSDDDSKERNHGLIPDATSAKYVPEFGAAAKDLKKVGDISPPTKTQFGYHLLKAVKIVPAHQRTFEEVKPALLAKLEQDYVASHVQDHLDGIKSRKLEANMDLVKSLTSRYEPKTKPAAGSPASDVKPHGVHSAH